MPKKILIVEDDIILQMAIVKAIEDEGFDVLEAVDGEEALYNIETEKPDLVLLDLLLPKKTGWRVLKEIREHKSEPIRDIPVIVLTAIGEDKSLKECSKYGIDDYLIKSEYSLDTVIEKIKNSLI
jgi:CheY-like chemotaxis protein